MAKVFDFRFDVNDNDMNYCSSMIRAGETVIFPTETVYGIGADATNEAAVSKIFTAKGREGDNPLIVHISNMEMLNEVVKNPGEIEMKLAETFWPGPLTIIFDKKENIPYNVTAGLETVGVRMPDNEIALRLIELSKCPIAAPSANISGRPSGTKISDIIDELDSKVDNIIDFGDTKIGVESTVVKVVDDCIKVLRPGRITTDDLLFMGFKVQLDEHIFKQVNAGDKVESPGMKYRHYAPNTKCIMVTGKDYNEVVFKINDIIKDSMKNDKTLYVLGYDEDLRNIKTGNSISIGSRNDLSIVAHNIFTKLREVDEKNVDFVLIEMIPKNEIGLAIYNRVIRACEYKTI